MSEAKKQGMVKYLSPSSLMQCENNPYTFLTTRILKCKERDPQGEAAAIGSSFDVYIKNFLLNADPIKKQQMHTRVVKSCWDPEQKETVSSMTPIEAMYHLSVEEHHRPMARFPGMNLAMAYLKSKTCKDTVWEEFEQHQWYDLWWKGAKIPLFMKLDAIARTNGAGSPFDWKVMGSMSEVNVQPLPGYKHIEAFDSPGFLSQPHESYFGNIPMQSINEAWATQLCTYGWGTGHTLGAPFHVCVDCLIFRRTGWIVARYIGLIDTDFQLALAARYAYAWQRLQSGQFMTGMTTDPDVANALARAEHWY